MLLEPELDGLRQALDAIPRWRAGGLVSACGGGAITASGLGGRAGVGEVCLIERRPPGAPPTPLFDARDALLAEVVGFTDAGVQLIPYEEPRASGTVPAWRSSRGSTCCGRAWAGAGG